MDNSKPCVSYHYSSENGPYFFRLQCPSHWEVSGNSQSKQEHEAVVNICKTEGGAMVAKHAATNQDSCMNIAIL